MHSAMAMKFSYISLFVFNSLYIAPVLSQNSNNCLTPNQTVGQCIRLRDCPSLLKMLNKIPIAREDSDYIRNSECGISRPMDPSVCCSTQTETQQLGTIYFSDADFSTKTHLNYPTVSRNTSETNNRSCQIPNNPPNGRYAIRGDDQNTYKEGDYVPEYLVVLYTKCDEAYKPSPPDVTGSYCVNGLWDPIPSVCSRTCKTLRSTETTDIKCSFNNLPLKNCDNAVEGTIAKFTCAALYEEPSIESNPYRFCEDGDWNGTPKCYPICGQKHPEGQTNVINGTVAKMGDYPWHVGVYTDQRDFLCGGAVITQTIVLSAAHCFANLGTGEVHTKENYLIAAGKYYRDYSDARDIHSQYSSIDSINIPSYYKGSKLQHQADIAVIVLTRHFVLSEAIQPVCVDWSDSFENQQLTPNNEGIVTGWGYTQEGLNLAEELKELSIPFIPFDQCFEAIPREFQTYLRPDKMCGGYLNIGTSVCQGDSGGALAFPKRYTGRYFVRGIVSTSPATVEKQCDSNQYGIYTLVSQYLDFINSVRITRRRHQANTLPADTLPTISNISHIASTLTTTAKICAIPQSPENGIYIIGRSVRNQSNVISNTASNFADPLDYLIVRCNEGYVATKTDISICVDGNWSPDPSDCRQSGKPYEGSTMDAVPPSRRILRPANCIPELQTVEIPQNVEPTILYIPSGTRVERCGGICSHNLLSCQPTETEVLEITVIKGQQTNGTGLRYLGKEILPIERHLKCKCACRLKESDCNSTQEYRRSECICV